MDVKWQKIYFFKIKIVFRKLIKKALFMKKKSRQLLSDLNIKRIRIEIIIFYFSEILYKKKYLK